MGKYKKVKLKEIAKIESGGTPSRKKKEYWENGNIPWVKIGDIDSKYLSKVGEYITQKGFENSNTKLFSKNTILYTIFATIGEVSILNIDACTNQAIVGININSNTAIIEYVYYYLRSLKDEMKEISRGVAQNNINMSILKDIEVPLPSMGIQKKIVNKLNKAQELIDKRKQQIEKYDEFLQSLFLDMFGDPVSNPRGWEFEKLGNLVNINMGQSPKGETYNKIKNGVPLLNGPSEFGHRYPKEIQWTTDSKKSCKNGDLLFCVRGATAGKMNFADKVYSIGRGLAALTPIKNISLEYIYVILKYQYDIFQETSNGSTFINIDKEKLSKVKVPMIEFDLQERYLKINKKIEFEKNNLEKNLAKLENNFKNILQTAFKNN